MSEIKPIETFYNGYRFRSRLEARWAVFFDAVGIKYEYEPEGYVLSDGTCYLPDFYLPEMDEFFEVKGVLKLTDERRVKQFIDEYRRPVVLGFDDMTFIACNDYDDGFKWARKDESVLAKCNKCNKLFFTGMYGAFICQCCRFYSGDSTFKVVDSGNHGDGYYESSVIRRARLKAKQARFEYGEKG